MHRVRLPGHRVRGQARCGGIFEAINVEPTRVYDVEDAHVFLTDKAIAVGDLKGRGFRGGQQVAMAVGKYFEIAVGQSDLVNERTFPLATSSK
jgi:hypothetical protein